MRLPDQIQLMEVDTDPALLERLLRNLLVNAFRYTLTGGVRLSVRAQDRSLDFRVVDTGPGIARSMRERVFDEFFQAPVAPSAKTRRAMPLPSREERIKPPDGGVQRALNATRGIGLGLSISARLADKLGSRIRLHSHLEHGSVFAFRQPMRVALRPQEQERPAATSDHAVALPAGLFVAVIEDDDVIRLATRQMLELMGAEVFTAESASQATQHLGQSGRMPDFIVSDFRLGTENGIQAIAMLRQEFNHDIPALLITGDTSPEKIDEFRREGLAVLYKPVASTKLLRAILEGLRDSSLERPSPLSRARDASAKA
jgi:CheY-like chemotaxis protein